MKSTLTTITLEIPQGRYTSVATVMTTTTKSPRMKFAKKNKQRRDRRFFRVMISAMVLLVGGLGTVQTATAAEANPITDAINDQVCRLFSGQKDLRTVSGATTLQSLYPAMSLAQNTIVDSRTGVSLTPQEAFAMNFAFTSVPIGSACGPAPMFNTMLSNFIFSGTKMITSATIGVYQLATNPDTMKGFEDAAELAINGTSNAPGLRDALYFEYLAVIMVIASLYLGWVGLVKKRALEAGSAAVWVISATVFGSVSLYNPVFIPSVANSVVGSVSVSTANMGANVSSQLEDSNNTVCVLPDKTLTGMTITTSFSPANRLVACRIWETYVYTPYAVGQFGSAQPEIPEAMMTSSTAQVGDRTVRGHLPLAQIAITSGDIFSDGSDRQAQWDAFIEGIEESNPSWTGSWVGGNVDRMGVSLLSLVGSLLGGVTIVYMAGAIFLARLMVFILVILSPLVLLVGALPKFGQGIVFRWLGAIGGMVVNQIVFALMISIALFMFNLALVASDGFFMQLVLVIMSSVVALVGSNILKRVLTAPEYKGTEQKVSGMFRGIAGASMGGAVAMGSALAGGAGIGMAGKAALKGATAGAVTKRPVVSALAGSRIGSGVASRAKTGNQKAQRAETRAEGRKAREEQRVHDFKMRTDPVYRDTHMNKEREAEERKLKHERVTYEKAYRRAAETDDTAWFDDYKARYGHDAPKPEDVPTGKSGYSYRPQTGANPANARAQNDSERKTGRQPYQGQGSETASEAPRDANTGSTAKHQASRPDATQRMPRPEQPQKPSEAAQEPARGSARPGKPSRPGDGNQARHYRRPSAPNRPF